MADDVLAVVVRFTHYEGVGVADCVDLMRVFDDAAAADAEADRLNAVRRDRVEYFVKIVRKRTAG